MGFYLFESKIVHILIKMDSIQFPPDLGNEMSGLTFLEVFEKHPKIVEFVRKLWIERSCSGIFLDFFKYVRMMLQNSIVLEEHETRCKQYVKSTAKVPQYMMEYLQIQNADRIDAI